MSNDNGRVGDWMLTASGRRIWPADIRPGDLHLEDIASALDQIRRFGGHTVVRGGWSVVQHSVLVANNVPDELQLVALLHDATEAYLGDVPRPLKRALPDYKLLERRAWAAVVERWDLSWWLGEDLGLPPEVKLADRRALQAERLQLMAPPLEPLPWLEDHDGIEPLATNLLKMVQSGLKNPDLWRRVWLSRVRGALERHGVPE